MDKKILDKFVYILFFLLATGNNLWGKSPKIKPVIFDYQAVAKNYFNPDNPDPFPLTVQRGNNLYNSVSKNGKYLFYTTSHFGNYDIWFRDLTSSIIIPVTDQPAAEYKPAISPDGKKLLYVTEEFDSEGDIVLVDIDPEGMIEQILKKGENKKNSKILNLTNGNSTGKERSRDTDPFWSPDGRYIIFSTDRFSRGTMNLAIIDTKKIGNEDFSIKPLTVQGGESPFWSDSGILYISYRDSLKGEIYQINNSAIKSAWEREVYKDIRITNNDFMEFSPSKDGNFIYFTAITKDANNDGKTNTDDASVIIRYEIKTGDTLQMTSEQFSAFDTKFSNFNGGSIVFSASLYHTINVYFIPLEGQIPRQKNIEEQFLYIQKYLKNHSLEGIRLAVRSLKNYYISDPLYLVYSAKADLLKLEQAKKFGNTDYYNLMINDMKKSNNPYTTVLLMDYQLNSQGKSSAGAVMDYYAKLSSDVPSTLRSSILEIVAEEYSTLDPEKAISIYKKITDNEMRMQLKIGDLKFKNNPEKIPEEYRQIFISNPDHSIKKEIYINIESIILNLTSVKSKESTINKLLSSFGDRENELYFYLLLFKAKNLNHIGSYKESNEVLDSFISLLKKTNYIYLSGRMLRASNNRLLGEVNASLDDLREFLDNYNPEYKIDVDEEMEKSFSFFENKAIEHNKRGNLKEAAFHYFFNTQNMYLCRAKNLYNETLYEKYSVYYQQKMVDSIIAYAKAIAFKKNKKLFKRLNILTGDGISILGGLTTIAGTIPGIKGVKNWTNVNVIDPEGLEYIESHFKLKLPLARPVLDYASVYGYAYYLISKSVIMDEFYRKTDTMTSARKEDLFKNFKIAEYELKWIIFSNPRYTDAYQLLGWLYQYIDIVKNLEISSGNHHEAVYAKYFPLGHFEENIDLYHQVLDLIGSEYPNKKALSDLHLNLANNYFILNNYPKSYEHYLIVENLGKYINQSIRFENFHQEALFRFHFAKSAAFIGENNIASNQFSKTAEIYTFNEFWDEINNRLDKLANEDAPLKKANQISRKLALVNSLNGLTLMDAKNYEQALPYLLKADKLNAYAESSIQTVNLKNLIIYCYLKIGKYYLAEKAIQEAKILYEKNKPRYKFNFSPEDLFWQFAMPNEFRVIGEGQIPGKMSMDFQHLFTLGLEVSARIDELDYKAADKILQKKIKLATKQKNTLGNYALVNSILTSAWLKVNSNDYSAGENEYLKAYKKSKEFGIANYARRALGNLAIFYIKVADKNNKSITTNKILHLKELLEQEFKEAVEGCLLINGKDAESLCLRNVYAGYKEYDPLMGKIHSWLARNSLDPLSKTFHYSKAWAFLKNPGDFGVELIGSSQDVYTTEERLEMKLELAKIQRELDDIGEYQKSLGDIEEFSYEFYLEKGQFQTLLLLAKESILKNNSRLAIDQLLQAKSMLNDNPDLIVSLPTNLIKKLYILLEQAYYNDGDKTNFFKQDRILQKTLLFRQAINSGIEFTSAKFNKDVSLNEIYHDLKTNLAKAISVQGNIKQKKIKRLVLRKEEEELKQLRKEISRLLTVLANTDLLLFDPFDKKFTFSVSGNYLLLKKYRKIWHFLHILNGKVVYFSSKEDLTQAEFSTWLLAKINHISLHKELILIPDSNLNIGDLLGIQKTLSTTGHPVKISSEMALRSSTSFNHFDDNLLKIELNDTGNPLADTKSKLIHLFKNINLSASRRLAVNGKASLAILLNLHRVIYSAGIETLAYEIKQDVILLKKGAVLTIISAGAKNTTISPVSFERIGDMANAYSAYLNESVTFQNKLKLAELAARSGAKTFTKAYQSIIEESINADEISLIYGNIIYVCYTEEFSNCYEIKEKYYMQMNQSDRDKLDKFLSFYYQGKDYTNQYEADQFIGNYYLAKISLRNLELVKAKNYLQLAKAGNKLEQKRIDAIKNQNQLYSLFFFGEGGFNYSVFDQSSTYDNVLLQKYSASLYNTFLNYKKTGTVNYKILLPIAVESKDSELYQINSFDRSLLFFLLWNAIPWQKTHEINDFVKIILDIEKGNQIRTAAMILKWAETLFTRGDFEAAITFLTEFEKILSANETLINETIQSRYHLLQYKLFMVGKKKTIDKEIVKKSHPDLFLALNQPVKDSINTLRVYIATKDQQLLNLTAREDLNDLIYILQSKAFKANNSELFFDLALIKDNIRAVNERIFGREVRFSDIQKIEIVSDRLLSQLPQGQVFMAVMDFGLETYYIRFYEGKSNGNLLYKDNRMFRNELENYYNVVGNGGSNILDKESLEDKLKKGIKLDNKLTYLYLSDIHFRTPIEQKSNDNFYFVLSPSLLFSRSSFNMHYSKTRNFNLQYFAEKTDDLVKQMEEKEISLGNFNSEVKVNLSGEKISFEDSILFGSSSLIKKRPERKGLWMITGLELDESFKNDNFESTLRFLDNFHNGLGVISYCPQNDYNNIYFLKSMVANFSEPVSFKKRFLDSIEKVRKRYIYDIEWIGYRMYTNTLINDN